MSKLLLLISITSILSGCAYNRAEETEREIKPSPASISYSLEIKPILVTHCYSCHTDTATDPESPGYAFFNKEDDLKKYASSPSPTNPSYTRMQARLRGIETPAMPFQKPALPDSVISKIDAWIKAGAVLN